MIIWQIIFWTSIALILHSYLFFPALLRMLSINKKSNDLLFPENKVPKITILMSVHNEEAVLSEKLESILSSDYPAEKITVFVGSDASDDKTNEILSAYEKKDARLKPFIFKKRKGKPHIINQLVQSASDDILVLTDAKVIFRDDTLYHLTRHFANPSIGAVGGNIRNNNRIRSGTSLAEKTFMSREIIMKYREGLIWGASTGLYGALFAIRKKYYTPVPKGFAVDDFFISMNVLRHEASSILDIEAIAHEDIPNKISEEYRRKVRIATGNFKNVVYFKQEALTPWKGASFAYISHKLIRWMGPLLLLFVMTSNIFIFSEYSIYKYSAYAILMLCIMSIIDYLLGKFGIQIVFLRFVRHFISMNIALLHGFIKFLRGETYDVWKPTNRS